METTLTEDVNDLFVLSRGLKQSLNPKRFDLFESLGAIVRPKTTNLKQLKQLQTY